MATSTTTHARTQAAAPEKRSHGREEAKAEAEASNTNFRPKEEGEGDSTGEKISAGSRRGIIMAKRRLLLSFRTFSEEEEWKCSFPSFPYLVAVGAGGVGGQETVTREASSIAITPSSSSAGKEGRKGAN